MNFIKKQNEYCIPDGGDINVYFSYKSCKDKLNLADISKFFVEKLNLNVNITWEDTHIYIYSNDNKYRVSEEWFKPLDTDFKTVLIKSLKEDNDIEYISTLENCDSKYMFDSTCEYETYLIYCFALYLCSLKDSNVLIYDTFNDKYLNENEIQEIIIKYKNIL